MSKLNYFDREKSGDVILSGYLAKQSPSMFVTSFQKRYCVLTYSDRVLRYFKEEQDVKEAGSIHLSDYEFTQPQNSDPECKIFVVKLKGQDRMYVFEAETHDMMRKWANSVRDLCKGVFIWQGDHNSGTIAQDLEAKEEADSSASNKLGKAKDPEDFVKFGFLNKQSSNALVLNMQKRYIEISRKDFILRYYKKEHDIDPAGICSLNFLDYVKPRDDSKSCQKFEIKSQVLSENKLVLEAPSHQEMLEWILAVEAAAPESRCVYTCRIVKGEDGVLSCTPAAELELEEEQNNIDKIEGDGEGGEEQKSSIVPTMGGSAPSSPARKSHADTEVADSVNSINSINLGPALRRSGILKKQSHNKYMRSMSKYVDELMS